MNFISPILFTLFILLTFLIILLFHKEVIIVNKKLNHLLYGMLNTTYINGIPHHMKKEDHRYIVRLTNDIPSIKKSNVFTIICIKITDSDDNLYSVQDILLQIINQYSKTMDNKKISDNVRKRLIESCLKQGLIKTRFHTNRYFTDINGGTVI